MAWEHLTRPSLAALLSGFSLEEFLCIAALSNTSPEQPGEHHEGLLEHQQTVQRLRLGDLGQEAARVHLCQYLDIHLQLHLHLQLQIAMVTLSALFASESASRGLPRLR